MLNGEKWHVTSFNMADHVFFQAKLTDGEHAGQHAMFVVDMDTPGIRVVRAPTYTHTYRGPPRRSWRSRTSGSRPPT